MQLHPTPMQITFSNYEVLCRTPVQITSEMGGDRTHSNSIREMVLEILDAYDFYYLNTSNKADCSLRTAYPKEVVSAFTLCIEFNSKG
jgi:hypothetical protein